MRNHIGHAHASPSRQIGQPLLIRRPSNPNLVEGRELWSPTGIAFDFATSPPLVYVADTLNNRVLAWKNSTGFSNGQPADLVDRTAGQVHDYQIRSGHRLYHRSERSHRPCVWNGDLYVADSGNNRVLRYKAPSRSSPKRILSDAGSLRRPAVAEIEHGELSERLPPPRRDCSSPAAASNVLLAGIAFDASGNMWVTDPATAACWNSKPAMSHSGGGLLTRRRRVGGQL